MEEGQPSFTAIASAMSRAAHLLWDDAPKIFRDTFALRLSGCESETALRLQLDRLAAEAARSTSPHSIPEELVDEESQRMLEVVAAMNASRGEPFKSRFEPVRLMEQVRNLGFAEVSDLSPGEAEARYFPGRTDSLRPPASEHYMCARVGRDLTSPALPSG